MLGLINIRDYIGKNQLSVIEQGLKGEEHKYFSDKLNELEQRIYFDTPKTYETDGQGDTAIEQQTRAKQ